MKLALVIDLGGTNIKYGLSTSKGELLYSDSVKTEAYLGKHAIVSKLLDIINLLIQKAVADGNTVSGIGFGSPGIIDSVNKCLLGLGNNLKEWSNINFQTEIGDIIKLPIFVENDANLAAIGEYHFGDGMNDLDFVMITLGTGIGGGVIKQNQIYRGSSFVAGEFGHMVVQMKGRKCNCGRFGCWEAYASCSSFQKYYKRQFNTFKSASQILTLYYDKLLSYREVCFVDEFFEHVLIGLMNIVNAFDPHYLLIGGGLSEAHSKFVPDLNDRLRNMLPYVHKQFEIKKASLGNKAALLGGAALVFSGENEC